MLLRNKCIVHGVIIAIDRKRAAIAECQLALPSKVNSQRLKAPSPFGEVGRGSTIKPPL